MDDEIIIGVTTTNKSGEGKKRPSPKKKRIRKIKKNNKEKNPKADLIKKLVGAIVLIIALIVFLMVSPTFNINKIIVEGNFTLSNEKIISLSGIKEGDNIFRFNSFSVCDKIKSNMYIESVSVKRKFPDTIKISVKERIVKYVIEYAGGYAYIDAQGYIIDIKNEKKDVPILQGYLTDISEIKVGNRLNSDDLNKLNITNDVVNVAESNGILSFITKIDITNNDNYVLILEGEEKTVYLGDCSDLVTRIARLKAIISETSGKAGIIYIDGNTSNQNPVFKENIN